MSVWAAGNERYILSHIAAAGNAVRYSVKAVGDLDTNRVESAAAVEKIPQIFDRILQKDGDFGSKSVSSDASSIFDEAPQFVRRPYNNGTSNEWLVDAYDIEALAVGCGVLGTGGGGSPYLAKLRLREALKRGETLKIVKPEW